MSTGALSAGVSHSLEIACGQGRAGVLVGHVGATMATLSA